MKQKVLNIILKPISLEPSNFGDSRGLLYIRRAFRASLPLRFNCPLVFCNRLLSSPFKPQLRPSAYLYKYTAQQLSEFLRKIQDTWYY